jgi:hypothetical protein
MLQNSFQFLLSFVAALYLNWNLTVVLLVSLPIIGTSGEAHNTVSNFFIPYLVSASTSTNASTFLSVVPMTRLLHDSSCYGCYQ